MDTKIYNLHVGSTFLVYGGGFNYQDPFHVYSIRADIASCRQENSHQILMLPLNISMPFAICILPDESNQRENSLMPPAHDFPGVTDSPGKISNQETSAANANCVGRIISEIEYYSPAEQWGKIHFDGMPHGLFFHITQVEDENLRRFLAGLSLGSKITPLKISYVKSYNPNHHNSICAGAICAEEELPQAVMIAPPDEVNHTGFVSEYESSGAVLITSGNQTFRTKYRTQIDPMLKAYLENYSTSGLLDNQNLKVNFITVGRLVLRVEWINREEVMSEQGITLDNYVSDKEIEAFNDEANTLPAETVIPAYQELPVWKA